MKTATTATLPIVPFDFESHEVRVITIDSNPWFCLRDMCDVLELDKNRPVSRFRFNNEGVAQYATPSAGGAQSMFYINEGNVFRLIARSKKPQAIQFERWMFDEVLPAIRKHGRYEDTCSKMTTLIDQTIGTTGFQCLKGIVDGKIARLPRENRRGAKIHLWQQLHKAFSVVSAEDIPIESMSDARNFVAAYALEGEYIANKPEKGIFFDDMQAYSVYVLIGHAQELSKVFKKYDMYEALSHLQSRAGAEMVDHINGGYLSAERLKRDFGNHFDDIQRRHGLNQYGTLNFQ